MITARENILMAYHHEEPYWVPSQYLDQNTCVYPASQEGAHGYGVNQIDCFGVSWDFLPGMEGQMVTKGTKRIEDLSEWRDVLTMPDVEKWDWEGGAARDTAHWDRKNKISSVIIINGLFEQLHTLTGFEDALCYLLTFGILCWLYYGKDLARRRPGILFGVGLIGIFLTRFIIEFIKTEQEAFEVGWTLDMGQWLSIPFIVLGIFMIWWGASRPAVDPAPMTKAPSAKTAAAGGKKNKKRIK